MRERKSWVITVGRLVSHLSVNVVPREALILKAVVFAPCMGPYFEIGMFQSSLAKWSPLADRHSIV